MSGSSAVLKVYLQLFTGWARILMGRSYFHVSQGLGPHFVPGKLNGYFIDLRAKTKWSGATDPDGIPLNRGRGQELVHFPTTIFHKGLGHWDSWIASHRQETGELDHMLAIVRWARDHQDEAGGWKWHSALQRSGAVSPYSAMSQGEGASLLCRAFSVLQEEDLIVRAERALELALTPVDRGGTARWTDGGLFLEEYPLRSPRTVLNGWIYSLFGIYDFLLVRESEHFRQCLGLTLRTLVRALPAYNCGYWSLYDSGGEIASPSYQERHVAQLRALEMTFEEHAATIAPVRLEFERQLTSPSARARAIGRKVLQKFRRAPDFVLR